VQCAALERFIRGELTMDRDPAAPPELVRLFTDGACSGNPGPGGWAFVLQHPSTGKCVEESGAELDTTNNRMELTGAIEGLKALKRPCDVELVTDSQYVTKGISEWMPGWKRQGWRRKEGKSFKPVINVDLWQRLDELLAVHRVKVKHVLGHRGHPENEKCDRMAVEAYKKLLRGRNPA
jgi:ribonuclease HI